MTIRYKALILAAVIAAAPAMGQPLEDDGLITETPLPDPDLVVVRELAYGSEGVDLTPFGIGSGPVDFVQSIYFRAFTADDAGTPASFAYRVEFPPEVGILGVVSGAVDLGGSSDDGIATGTDLIFGVAANPDDYSEILRGFESGGSTGSSEFIGVPRPNVLTLALNVIQGVDDFRVIIDFGDSFPPDLAFNIEKIGFAEIGGAALSDGIQVGIAGSVPGSGDHGELASLTGVPLTGTASPTSGEVIEYDPQANLFILRNPILGRIDGYDVFKDVPWQNRFTLTLGVEAGITDGTDGLLYAIDRDALIARIDPIAETVEYFSAPDSAGNIVGLTACPGTTDLFLMRDTSGATWVDRMETATFTYTEHIEISSAEVANPRGITDGPDGLLYLLASGGRIVAIDPVAGTSATVVIMSPPSGSYTGLTAMPLQSRLLYLIRDKSGNTEVDTWDVDTGQEVYGFSTMSEPAAPKGITDGPGSMIYAVGSSGGYASIDPVTGEVITSHAAFDFSGSNVAVTAVRTNFATSPVPRSGPDRTRLDLPAPNPFNPRTKLAFELTRADHVRLTIHDTAGRLVAVLLNEDRTAGRHAVFWDGSDRHGRHVPSGVYFYRLETGSYNETRKLVLLK